MKHKMTHIGKISGDARARVKHIGVLLRETKLHWIDERGVKYRKTTGAAVGQGDWPMYHLDVSTIEKMEGFE